MANKTKKILIILPSHDFREEEYLGTREVLEKAGIEVKVASSTSSGVKGRGKFHLKPDFSLDKVRISEYDGIVFIGGPGAKEYFHNQDIFLMVQEAVSEGKIVAAICLGTLILAYAGVLSGKRATVCEQPHLLKEHGGIYTGSAVERDDNIITAQREENTQEFASQIVKALRGS